MSVALSAILGVVMTYSTVLCNSVNSPLATSVTGNTKDLISTLIGVLNRCALLARYRDTGVCGPVTSL